MHYWLKINANIKYNKDYKQMNDKKGIISPKRIIKYHH